MREVSGLIRYPMLDPARSSIRRGKGVPVDVPLDVRERVSGR